MIPSKNWFPMNLQDRAAWFGNFNSQMQDIGLTLGFVAGDLTALEADNDIIQFLAESDVSLSAYTDAVRNYRKGVTEGNIGERTPGLPANITLTSPGPVPTGIFERLDAMVKRVRVAPAYTDEIGALLGILITSGGGSRPTEIPPVLKATVDPGNIIEVKFVKGDSSGAYIETNVDNAGWSFADKAVKSPAIFDVPANPNNTPRGVQIRARYLDGNNPVGDWSDIVTVQTIP